MIASEFSRFLIEVELITNPQTIHANLCVAEYGRGYAGFNFDTLLFEDGNQKELNIYDYNNFPCPRPRCVGFVNNEICGLCNGLICKECREEKLATHICNHDTLLTLQMIRSTSKNCPKCLVPIYKSSGCDQMFCIECKTTFSYITGRIVDKLEIHHNPHYIEWNRRNIGILNNIQPIRVIHYNCNEYITKENLLRCFSAEAHQTFKFFNNKMPAISDIFKPLINEAHYMCTFLRLHKNILDVRATAGNHAYVRQLDFHDLRVRFMLNEFNENDFMKLLEKRYYDHHKSLLYCNIYMMVYDSAIVLFDNLFAFCVDKKIKGSKLDFMFNIYIQFQKILEFANEKLEFNKRIYGHDERFIKFHR